VSQPRLHHYVPKSYLRRFTSPSPKGEVLWVLDKKDLRQFQSSPGNVAAEKDFYRATVERGDPYALERTFATLEGKSARVIEDVVAKRALPTGDDMATLVEFVALMTARVPGRRVASNEATDEVGKMALRMVAETQERFEAVARAMRERGEDPGRYESFRDFVFSDRYAVRASQNTHLGNLRTTLEVLVQLLPARHWYLLVPQKNAGLLIASDCPVSLTWDDGRGRSLWSPGFGLSKTLVTMALSSDLALGGVFKQAAGTVSLDRLGVAQMNSLTGMYATRFLFSAEEDFPWLSKDGSAKGVEALLNAMRDVPEDER
jgi:hypothetical protein